MVYIKWHTDTWSVCLFTVVVYDLVVTMSYMLLIFCTRMLSKTKGQILRVAAVLHVLFQIHTPNVNGDHEEACVEPDKISDKALCAAVDFVEISTQHAAYIAEKDTIFKELERHNWKVLYVCMQCIHLLLLNHLFITNNMHTIWSILVIRV